MTDRHWSEESGARAAARLIAAFVAIAAIVLALAAGVEQSVAASVSRYECTVVECACGMSRRFGAPNVGRMK